MTYTKSQLEAALKAERDRCAEVCREIARKFGAAMREDAYTATECAAAIRALPPAALPTPVAPPAPVEPASGECRAHYCDGSGWTGGYSCDPEGMDNITPCPSCRPDDHATMFVKKERKAAPASGEAVIEALGDAATDVFEQMERGAWEDDHGHDVRWNAAMLRLKDAVGMAIAHRSNPASPAAAGEVERARKHFNDRALCYAKAHWGPCEDECHTKYDHEVLDSLHGEVEDDYRDQMRDAYEAYRAALEGRPA